MTTDPQPPFRVLTYLTTGSSTPIVVQDAGGLKWLVKLKGGQSGRFSCVNEWVAGHLGAAIGLPVVTPGAILLDGNLETGSIHVEVKDLINKSFGLNLAFPFFENAVPCSAKTAHVAYDDVVQKLFAYDVFLLNTDRTAQNPNLLELDGRVFSFDYETSFLLMGVAQGRDFSQSDFVLRALRENPLFREDLNAEAVSGLFTRLQQADIAGIVDSLPDAWALPLNPDAGVLKENLKKGLAAAVAAGAGFAETLRRVTEITPENEEDKRKRREANRTKFEQGLIPIEILE